MTVLRTAMSRRIAVNVFSVDVGPSHDQRLNDAQVTADACDMQWSSEISRSAILLSTELNKSLNQVYMALVGGNMERGPAVRVTLVNQSFAQTGLLTTEDLQAY